MAFVARNGIWLSKVVPTDAQLATASTGFVQAVASGQLRLASLSSNVSIDAGGQTGVLTVGSNQVVVKGGLDVLGAINALETNDLHVRDRLVCLANYDDLPPLMQVDVTNGAGILVGSRNTDGTSNEVSFRWNKPSPTSSSQQATWDVVGGSLRLSRRLQSGHAVAYRFAINDAAELEVTREVAGAGGSQATTQRVAAWGRPSSSSAVGLDLPTRLNPYQ